MSVVIAKCGNSVSPPAFALANVATSSETLPTRNECIRYVSQLLCRRTPVGREKEKDRQRVMEEGREREREMMKKKKKANCVATWTIVSYARVHSICT